MRAEKAWLTLLACCDFPNSDILINFTSTCSLWRWWTDSLVVTADLSFQPVGLFGWERRKRVRWPCGWKGNPFATLPTISEHTTSTPSPRSLMSLKKLVKSSSQRVWAECQWERANEPFKDSTVLAELGLNQAREDLCTGQKSHKKAMQLLDTWLGLFKGS